MKIITSLLVASTIALNAQVLATVNSEDVSKNDVENFLKEKGKIAKKFRKINNTRRDRLQSVSTKKIKTFCKERIFSFFFCFLKNNMKKYYKQK